jgi:hypothetical protein
LKVRLRVGVETSRNNVVIAARFALTYSLAVVSERMSELIGQLLESCGIVGLQ